MHREDRRSFLKKLLYSGLFLSFTLSTGSITNYIKEKIAERGIVPSNYGFVDGKFDLNIFKWAMAKSNEAKRNWRYEWVFVIDLERCDGCGLCERACIAAHEPLPEQTWIKVYSIAMPNGYYFPLPRPCMQCQRAPCVSVCPVGANYYNEDGVVIIDKDRCIGCRMCMAACPYGARYFNWEAPRKKITEDHGLEVEHPVGVVEKCMFCYIGLEKGDIPVCVKSCVMNALFIGDVKQDFITNGKETYKLSELLSQRHHFRLFEELGTEPRVIYLTGDTPAYLYQEHTDFPLPP
jgi:molybdopterin-containing oxidoreductase family iron-sulfur binding subunit